jgi:hypothetical protein
VHHARASRKIVYDSGVDFLNARPLFAVRSVSVLIARTAFRALSPGQNCSDGSLRLERMDESYMDLWSVLTSAIL